MLTKTLKICSFGPRVLPYNSKSKRDTYLWEGSLESWDSELLGAKIKFQSLFRPHRRSATLRPLANSPARHSGATHFRPRFARPQVLRTSAPHRGISSEARSQQAEKDFEI